MKKMFLTLSAIFMAGILSVPAVKFYPGGCDDIDKIGKENMLPVSQYQVSLTLVFKSK